MVMGGVDLVTVKEILGHATIQMTMRYAHPTPENKRRAVEVLSGLIKSPVEQCQPSAEKMAPYTS
jgi:integrase